MAVADLRPLPVSRDPGRRIPQLLAGLTLYGTSMAMQLRATLGVDPWDVFHQGLARHLPLSFGRSRRHRGWSCCWPGSRCGNGRASARSATPCHRPGSSTPRSRSPRPCRAAVRAALLAGGILLNGVAAASYLAPGSARARATA